MNICLIKVSGDRILSECRVDDVYTDYQGRAEFILAAANTALGESRTLEAFACCDADVLQAAIDSGKLWVDGPTCEFDVILKSAVTTQTIIPPVGVAVEDIPSTDAVVCYVT